jgi:uncharacterized protein YdaU (DUF1376 family)
VAREPAQEDRFPWVPFYVDDWLTSDAIADFSVEQEGAYLRLLLRQWKSPDGVLPKDDATLAKYSRLGKRWKKVGQPIIGRCFIERPEGFVNLRLWNEWLHAHHRRDVARAAAAKRRQCVGIANALRRQCRGNAST